MSEPTDVATVAESLRLEGDLSPADLDEVIERFARLDHRLRSYPSGSVELILTMKERDRPAQRTTLEAKVGGLPRLVATSEHVELDQALMEVRDDLIRQLTDQKNKREPRQNRHLRDTET